MSNVLSFQLYILFCELIFFPQITFYYKRLFKYDNKNSKLCDKQKNYVENSNPCIMSFMRDILGR